jgi:hypothetical protein
MMEQPGYPVAKVLQGLSLPRRIGYVIAGLGGLAAAVIIGMLWATEPAPLPARTRLAFAALIAVGMVCAVFAAWALIRRPLFAVDRVIAATLAVGFTTLTTMGTIAVALSRSSAGGVLAAAGVGLSLIVVAALMLARARAYRARLLARRHQLQEPFTPADPNAGNNIEATDLPGGGRSILPIGPLALAMRHRRSGPPARRLAVVAILVGLALVAGVALLLR